MMAKDSTKQWYLEKYSLVAWIETIIKLIALVAAFYTVLNRTDLANLEIPEEKHLIQLVILVLLSLGLVAAIFDRIIEREIIAMGFVIINNLGHWGMVFALMTMPHPGDEIVIFAGLMLLADLLKLYWLKRTQFRVRDVPMSVMYGLTLYFISGYALLLLLELVGS